MHDPAMFDEILDLALELEELSRLAARAGTATGLLAAEARVIIRLMYSASTQGEISRAIGMDTGQLARTVGRLREKRLIASSEDTPLRKGSQRLRLTLAGRRAAHDTQKERMRLVQDYARDEPRLSRLIQCCHALADRLYTGPKGPFVRPADVGDAGSFLSLASVTLRCGFFGHFDERIEAELARGYLDYHLSRRRSLFLIAEFQGKIRGGLIAVPHSAKEARLPAFVVDKYYLCQSIGSALLKAAKSQLRALGYSMISTLAPRDPEGTSFFEHERWHHAGTVQTRDFGPQTNLDIWQLDVQS